jgi:hypothetical protein
LDFEANKLYKECKIYRKTCFEVKENISGFDFIEFDGSDKQHMGNALLASTSTGLKLEREVWAKDKHLFLIM